MLTRAHVERLALHTEPGPVVSIYLPTHVTGDGAQDPILFKKLLTEAEHDLLALGVSTTRARALLEPARNALADNAFWRERTNGLAVFLSRDGMHVFHLPIQVAAFAVVQQGFHLKPLLQLIDGDGRFYILALSLRHVRLFEATRETVRDVPLKDIPLSLLDAVGHDVEQRALHFHTGSGGSFGQGGRRHAMFHGHGARRDVEKMEIATFLRLVDDGVSAMVAPTREPLLVAGVEYISAMYRKLTKCPRVVSRSIDGSPEHVSREDLHAAAWPLVAPLFGAAAREAGERYATLAGTDRASADVAEVVQAACDGRVESMFAPLSITRWGSFDRQTRRIVPHEHKELGDRDLIDVAAVQAMMNGGKVYAVAPGQVPGGGEVAAVFRY